ncbi:MAG: succinate dehydrogenase cytochrome b subunit [Planctomycetes bacterium]|nr:succinate dehydrogenase cytochrome b subunit [Planctomycetota bacterium]
MPGEAPFLRSSIGRKVLMAVTGMIMLGFLAGHVAGNLLAFAGREPLDAYAKFLRESPTLLWGTRGALLFSVLVHIGAWVRLLETSRAARPVGYDAKVRRGTTLGARTMAVTGPVILFFVIYHILHFTLGTVHPDFRPHEVYDNVVTGFRQKPVALFYVVAMLALGLHLSHGIWSVFQTVGANHPRYDKALRAGGVAIAAAITAGFASVPVAVLAGVIR